MNNCEACGSPLMPGAFFCGECGSSTRPKVEPGAEVRTDTREVQLDAPSPAPATSMTPPVPAPRFADDIERSAPAPMPAAAPEPMPAPVPTPMPTPVGSVMADEPGDETVIRVRPSAQPAPTFTLTFANGDSITVAAGGLLGRNPAAPSGESHEHLIIVTDPDRTVSKTHLEFGIDESDFWVCDRYSGNGTTIFETGKPPRRLVPGRRYKVDRGTRVGIGEQSFTLV